MGMGVLRATFGIADQCGVTKRAAVAIAVAISLGIAVVGLFSSPASAQEPDAAQRPSSCAVATTGGTAVIEFTPRADDNAARYLLYRSENGVTWQWSGSVGTDAPAEFSWDETPGIDYAYAVKTRGVGGDFTVLTECGDGQAAVEGPGVAPESCAVERAGGVASVTFDAVADDNAARYLLYRNEDGTGWQWAASISANATEFTWDENAGVDHAYAVKTRGTDGGFSGLTECGGSEPPTPVGPTLAPTSCQVETVGGVAAITFEPAPDDNAARYLLYRREDGGDWLWSNSIDAAADLRFTWAEADGTTYTYKVQTRGIDGTFVNPYFWCTPPVLFDVSLTCASAIVDDGAALAGEVTWRSTSNVESYTMYVVGADGARTTAGSLNKDDFWAGTSVEFVYVEGSAVEFTATNAAGVESAPFVCLGPVPEAPRCSTMRSGENVTVAWESTGADEYYLYFYEYDIWSLSAVVPGDVAHWEIATSTRIGSPIITTYPGTSDYDYVGGQLLRAGCGSSGVLPASPTGCASTVAGDAVTVTWTPEVGDAADRYVIYARSADQPESEWQGSVGPDQTTFTKNGLTEADDTAWLVKTRTTLADGKHVFSDGTICTGSDVEYVAGDSIDKAFPIGSSTSVSGSTTLATVDAAEGAVLYNPDCYGFGDKLRLEPSVWYTWTPGAVGDFALTSGRDIAVYAPTGAVSAYADVVDDLVDCGATVTVTDPTATYYVQVFGLYESVYRGNDRIDRGNFTLQISWSDVPTPAWCVAIIRGDTVELSVLGAETIEAEAALSLASYEASKRVGGEPEDVVGSIDGSNVAAGVVALPYNAAEDATYSFVSVGTDGYRSAPRQCVGPVRPAPSCSIAKGANLTLVWDETPQEIYSTRSASLYRQFSSLEADATHWPWGRLVEVPYYVGSDVWPLAEYEPGRAFSALLSVCGEAEPGGLAPVDALSCTSSGIGNTVNVSWSPVANDAADRYVIYSRGADDDTSTWRGSAAPGQTTLAIGGVSAAADQTWLVQSRVTLSDGKRVFSTGRLCNGGALAIGSASGDGVIEAIPISGTHQYPTAIQGTLAAATVEGGEQALIDAGPCGWEFETERSVWYAWTPGDVGAYELELSPSVDGGNIAVYAPTGPIANIGDLASAPADCGPPRSWLGWYRSRSVDLTVDDPNATYYFQIFDPAIDPIAGTFSVTIRK